MNEGNKTSQKKEPPLMGLAEVATGLGISIDTARRYARGGRLPSVRIAGWIRVPREAVLRAQREGISAS